MRLQLLVTLSLLAAGCIGDASPEAPARKFDDADARIEPVVVYSGTIDFTRDPSGGEHSLPLDVPADARRFEFEVTWRAKGGVAAPTVGARVFIRDAQGHELASCDRLVGVTGRIGCGKMVGNWGAGPHSLVWKGIAAKEVDVTITAV